MKNIIIIVLAFFATNLVGQVEVATDTQTAEIKTAKFKTSAECGMCKKRIEKVLRKTDGVNYSRLHVPTKILKVKFDPNKLSEEDIRKVIASVGYDADDIPADEKAYKKLPDCCQKGGMDH